jgi:type IV secretory pathway TraG/TraD family ATPase VirD4
MRGLPSNDVSYFASTNFRNDQRVFGIRQSDRLFHLHLIGKTGTGKTTLIETLVAQDLHGGRGFCLIDPHGDLADRLFARVLTGQRERVSYMNVPNPSQPFGYNPLRYVRPERRSLAASGLMEAFKNIWADAWGVRMEHVLRNALLLLLEQPSATLPDVLRLFTDDAFRRQLAKAATNEQVRTFWLEEYEGYPLRYRAESVAPIQNKVGAFLADPLLYRVLVNPERDISFRRIMDEGGGVIINLAKGKIGEDSASLLGSLLVTTIGLAAFSRADLPEAERRPFFLYIDEFQAFTTRFIADMASELRKYRVGLILAHQHLDQLEPDIRHAVFGNVGTLISFRVGPKDAMILAREFQDVFEPIDLLNLANFDIYLRLMIDGAPSQPFSGTTVTI